MSEFKKVNKLDKVEQKLYSPGANLDGKPRSHFDQKVYNVNQNWEEEKEESSEEENPLKQENQKGMSIFSKILIVAFLFFAGAMAYAFYAFNFFGEQGASNVDISINSAISVAAGEVFSFDVLIENNNTVDIETIDLLMSYPDGTRDGKDITTDLTRTRDDVGGVSAGSFLKVNREVYLFGEEGDKKEIEAEIVYRIADSNAVFKKKKVFEVVLKSTPVRVNVLSVKEVTSAQGVEFDVEVISNANEPLNNVLVKAEYPFGFSFDSSTLDNQLDNNTWKIDELKPKETVKFKIKGNLQGQNNDQKFFRFNVGLQDSEKAEEIRVLFTSIGKTVVVTRPFLEIDVAVNNKNSSVINLNSGSSYEMKINYKNNTQFPIKDAEIEIKIDGEVLDEETVSVGRGFYRSLDNTIIFDKTTNPFFEELQVGESGGLSITFRSKSLIGEERFENPELSLSAVVKGSRYLDVDVPEEIQNEIFKKIRFNTVALIDTKSLYYDGPFENTGSIPPKVDNKTTYTISLALSNSSNRISNGSVEFKLPNYVKYEDVTWPAGQTVTYDPVKRTVTWQVGELAERTGFGIPKREMAFQVSIIPSISQRGSNPALVSDIVFTGNDLFTGEQIRVQANDLTTAIADSQNFFDGQVSQ